MCDLCKSEESMISQTSDLVSEEDDDTTYAENIKFRANMMKLFHNGLQCRIKRGAIAEDCGYRGRCSVSEFREEHLDLFPKCIQDLINTWYPVR